MDQRKEISKQVGKSKSFIRRIVAFMLVFAVAIGMDVSGFIGKTEEVSAEDKTTVTVSPVSIDGTVGTAINEQTIELTVENGKFDTKQFYVGKDLSNYFVKICSYGSLDFASNNWYFFSNCHTKVSPYIGVYYIPLGLKVIIEDSSESKITCSVSGTPFSPSKEKIQAYFKPSMFSEVTCSTTYVSCVNTDASWNIEYENTYKGYVEVSGVPDKVTGEAGKALNELEFTVNLKNACFALDIARGTDLSIWFSGTKSGNQLPVGVYVKAAEDVKMGDTSCKLILYGTPRYGCFNYFEIEIPSNYVIGSYASGNTFWRNMDLKRSADKYRFAIEKLEDEPTYLSFNNQEVKVYAGYKYDAKGGTDNNFSTPVTGVIRTYMYLYNGKFASRPDDMSNVPWNDSTVSYMLSNVEGNVNTDAEGFLYSAGGAEGAEGHLYVQSLYGNSNGTWESSTRSFYLSFYGTPYNVGEYPLSYFIPLNTLDGLSDEEGNTTVVVDKGKLIVMKPYQLEVDDADIELHKGETVDQYITVKTSVYSLQSLKNILTTETLKYSVSEDLKNLGIDLEPVSVTKDSVVFHMTGTVSAKTAILPLENCVTLDYSNFNSGNYADIERFGQIEINPNQKAVLKVTLGKGAYGVAGQEIDYEPREDVIIYPKNKAGEEVDTVSINMTQEKLVLGDVKIACYSTDGGKKWKVASSIEDAAFSKLLQKGMTFAIATGYDEKGKKPSSDAEVYKFNKTNKAGKAPKFKVNYSTYADETGESTGQYILTDKSGKAYTATALRSGYEIGMADSSGKTVDERGYGVWPISGGLTIAALNSEGKTQKTTYYIRTQATETTPASKPVKVVVSGLSKAPTFKVDYKKESIKIKAGISVLCGEEFIIKNATKADAKKAIDLSGLLSVSDDVELTIWSGASDKKPASALQTIVLAKRFNTSGLTLNDVVTWDPDKHTVKLNKDFEAYDASKKKWAGLPKIKSETVIKIRKKATAKGGQESAETYAASEEAYLIISWGIVDADKKKSGITNCELSLVDPATVTTETEGGNGSEGETGGDSGSTDTQG